MLNKQHIKLAFNRNVIVYDSSVNNRVMSTRFLLLLCNTAAKEDFLIRKLYYAPCTIFQIDCDGIWNMPQIIRCEELDYDGELYKYYRDDLKGMLPMAKSCMVVGMSNHDDVLLGAI